MFAELRVTRLELHDLVELGVVAHSPVLAGVTWEVRSRVSAPVEAGLESALTPPVASTTVGVTPRAVWPSLD